MHIPAYEHIQEEPCIKYTEPGKTPASTLARALALASASARTASL